jgi:hypothetical protein
MEQPKTLDQTSPLLDYIRHENGIHEFVVKRATRAAADAYFNQLEVVIDDLLKEGLTSDDTVRVLADFRSHGNPPMNYMFQRSKSIMTKYPVRPKTRWVNLHQNSFLLSLAQTFVSILTIATKDKVRILMGDKAREEALHWLLKDD